mmetsp:Transcript_36371/g.94978  ORF Transcript_36371/g.94978 Transcript_36371/m.94978 type:complete len:244 (-) Transcript_36371:681-1412(-)
MARLLDTTRWSKSAPGRTRSRSSVAVGCSPREPRRLLLHLEQGVYFALQVGDLLVELLHAVLQVLCVLGPRVPALGGGLGLCAPGARSLARVVRGRRIRRAHPVEEDRHHDVQDDERVDQDERDEEHGHPERGHVAPVVLGIPGGGVLDLEVVEDGANAGLRPRLAREDLEEGVQRRGEAPVVLRPVAFLAARQRSRGRVRQCAGLLVQTSEGVHGEDGIDGHHDQQQDEGVDHSWHRLPNRI